MKKVEHIGIAVSNLEDSQKVFEKLFNNSHYKVETVEREGVNTMFFQMGETKIELLEAKKYDSAIAKFIDKRGEGVHHLAFEVESLESEMERLKEEGFDFIYPKGKTGADNKMINFLHPKKTNGVLIELCEEITLDNTES